MDIIKGALWFLAGAVSLIGFVIYVAIILTVPLAIPLSIAWAIFNVWGR